MGTLNTSSTTKAVGSAGLLTTLGVGVFLLTEDVITAGVVMMAVVMIFGAVLLLRKPKGSGSNV